MALKAKEVIPMLTGWSATDITPAGMQVRKIDT
jgi:hypothetical protein